MQLCLCLFKFSFFLFDRLDEICLIPLLFLSPLATHSFWPHMSAINGTVCRQGRVPEAHLLRLTAAPQLTAQAGVCSWRSSMLTPDQHILQLHKVTGFIFNLHRAPGIPPQFHHLLTIFISFVLPMTANGRWAFMVLLISAADLSSVGNCRSRLRC